MSYRLAADIGGTFTDIVMLDVTSGAWKTGKVPTTNEAIAVGVLHGFDQLTGGDYSQVEDIVHGTTTGLNTVLEKDGARTALITTRGFRDIYEIGRGNHPDMYNARYRKPEPLVERKDVFELAERVRTDGRIEVDLDMDEVHNLVARLTNDYDSVAVCFINSIVNSSHEEKVRDEIRRVGGEHFPVTISSDVSADGQEYERFATTVTSAYIAPVLDQYLSYLENALKQRGFSGTLRIMSSGGGLISFSAARREAVKTLMSGPVGGVIGAAQYGRERGVTNLLAVDMGGTSFDVTLVTEGKLDVTTEIEVGGVPLTTSTVNTVSIGAGGGSIAWNEAGGMRVGPRSSGAIPGPVCYGRGGVLPTVTDANLVLGHIDAENFLGSAMSLDVDAARKALISYGQEFGLSSDAASEGILEIVDTGMANAIRQITLWQGKDVTDYSLVAYGGAGPLHAAAIADELDITSVIVPRDPGAFSAWGMLSAHHEYHGVVSCITEVEALSARRYWQEIETLESGIRERFLADGANPHHAVFAHALDLRYLGQKHFLTVPFSEDFTHEGIVSAFNAHYADLYGFTNPDAAIQVVSIRVTGTIEEQRKPLSRAQPFSGAIPRVNRELRAYLEGKETSIPVYDRATLAQNVTMPGPAIIAELTSTTFVPARWSATSTALGELLLSRND